MLRLITAARRILNIALAIYNRIGLSLTASLNHNLIKYFV